MIRKISVIIPTTGDTESIQRLLKSICHQNISKDHIETFIVVNGVDDEIEKKELRNLTDLYTELNLQVAFLNEKGVNRARNYGLNHSKNDLIFFFDDDCELQRSNFISLHLQFHNKYPSCFALGGGYELDYKSGYYDKKYNDIQMRWLTQGRFSSQHGRHLLGGNFSIKREIVEQHNLQFDDMIVYGGSEYEFFIKAGLKGLELCISDIDLLHHTHESLFSLSAKLFKQGRGKAYIDEKYNNKVVTQVQYAVRHDSIIDSIVDLYFNYVFWCGYYFFKKQIHKFILYIIKDFIAQVNIKRYQILNKITLQINNKKNKGDRF